MKTIGLLSDTHSHIDSDILNFFKDVDEIWHAGDIGNMETADAIAAFKPLKAVYGNVDNDIVRRCFEENLIFNTEMVKIWLTHIGGVPGNYDRRVRAGIYDNPPDIFICGHSHIAKIMYDRKAGLLYLNPGAAGYNGFHKYMTAIRFQIDGKEIHDMELIELGERGRVTVI